MFPHEPCRRHEPLAGLVPVLARAGHVATHWSEIGAPSATDREILTWARENARVVFTHDQARYPRQQILIVRVGEYACVVPFVETAEGRFLKTIIPSRKATREYLGDSHAKD